MLFEDVVRHWAEQMCHWDHPDGTPPKCRSSGNMA